MAWWRGFAVGLSALVWAACGDSLPVAGPPSYLPAEEPSPVAPEFLALFPASDGSSVDALTETAEGTVFIAGTFRGDLSEAVAGAEGRNAGRCPATSFSDEEVFAARLDGDELQWGRAFGARDGCAEVLGIGLVEGDLLVGTRGTVTFGGATLSGDWGLQLSGETGSDTGQGSWAQTVPGGPSWSLRHTATESFLERARELSVSVPLGLVQFGGVAESPREGDAVVAGSVREADAEWTSLAVWRVAPDGTVHWHRRFEFLGGAEGAARGFVAVEAVQAETDGGATLAVRFAGTLQLDVFVHGWPAESWTESSRFLVVRLERDGSVRWTREASRGLFGGVRLARAGNGGLAVWGLELTGDGVQAKGRPAAVLTWFDDEVGEAVRAQPLGAEVKVMRPSVNGGLLIGGWVTDGEGLGVGADVAPQTGFAARLPMVNVVPQQ